MNKYLLTVLIPLFLIGCQPAPAEPTVMPTDALVASTDTPAPTATKAAAPTYTPRPSKTPPPTPPLPDIPEAVCIPADGKRTEVLIVGAIDGDTIDVSVKGLTFRVRYLGIDAPEMSPIERLGPEATTRNRELVSGERGIMISDPQDNDMDPYGRLLRHVIVGDIFVNYQLVREGLARLYFSSHSCGDIFFEAYEAAQSDRIGLFGPTATPDK